MKFGFENRLHSDFTDQPTIKPFDLIAGLPLNVSRNVFVNSRSTNSVNFCSFWYSGFAQAFNQTICIRGLSERISKFNDSDGEGIKIVLTSAFYTVLYRFEDSRYILVSAQQPVCCQKEAK